ncbi:hypothetical protein Q765_00900 [Flavobacterium rivuli WB 3.3-2 = DSM 21788]|uniref:Uncharacterized protein n=1 Tax=Flavobacterium rivuli WB 3.3-2 = DSM 21788 TaxID=1121895 RepID=A0A0A2MA22_9FLAO|nr:hypothetical protein [Flavobacterium rivuli]KGO88496.1 hypothetical protein Q765_00900 [Flavobacterium rivuli WB 3.3-2 = DSM 21788]
MKKVAVACCLLIVSLCYAQKPAKPAVKKTTAAKPIAAKPTVPEKNEWDDLDITFVALVDALVKNDLRAFTALSLKEVDCIDCVGKPEFNNEGFFVSADVFYLNIAKNFSLSPVYKALSTRGYTFDKITIKNFSPRVLPRNYKGDLVLYEAWVPTYLVNELSKGHKGTSHGFQFIKTDGKFKFYGLTSIP